jgi:hypothetical protein
MDVRRIAVEFRRAFVKTLCRRAFLVVAAMLSPWSALGCGAPRPGTGGAGTPETSATDFLALSARLTGRTNLDAAAAATYLGALNANARYRPVLADLVRDGKAATPAHVELEREIITAWYTGTYTIDGVPRVATYAGALMWTVFGRPAPGICAGPTGFWSDPPSTRVNG